MNRYGFPLIRTVLARPFLFASVGLVETRTSTNVMSYLDTVTALLLRGTRIAFPSSFVWKQRFVLTLPFPTGTLCFKLWCRYAKKGCYETMCRTMIAGTNASSQA